MLTISSEISPGPRLTALQGFQLLFTHFTLANFSTVTLFLFSSGFFEVEMPEINNRGGWNKLGGLEKFSKINNRGGRLFGTLEYEVTKFDKEYCTLLYHI